MKNKAILMAATCLSLTLPVFAAKKHGERAMIEKMEAVPCGAKERGLTGLGSVFASIGATHVDSDEKLCPQYLLRTDDMEYHVRPLDHRHPQLLPIGKEGEFRLSRDVLEMKIPDGDHHKRRYQVVAMKPIDHSDTTEVGSSRMKYEKPQTLTNDRPLADKVPPHKPN